MFFTEQDPELLAAAKETGLSIKATLGSGAFATVHHAQDASGRCYALKCVDKECSSSDSVAREVDTMSLAAHNNILRLFWHKETESQAFMMLELCMGGDVFDRMDAMPEADSAVVLWQTLSALEHLHSNGIAHRDVKAENLLLLNPGPIQGNVLKLADFGLAARFDVEAPRSFLGAVGTSLYAAPEVFRGPYGPECDLWSAGVLLYMLLSGLEPFMGTASANTKSPRYGLNGSHWKPVSRTAKSLVRGLLEANVDFRLSASQAMDATWFRTRGCVKPESDSEASTASVTSSPTMSALPSPVLSRSGSMSTIEASL